MSHRERVLLALLVGLFLGKFIWNTSASAAPPELSPAAIARVEALLFQRANGQVISGVTSGGIIVPVQVDTNGIIATTAVNSGGTTTITLTTTGLSTSTIQTDRTQITRAVAEKGNGTTSIVTITTGGTSQTLLASNASRKGVLIQNPVDATAQGIVTAENLCFDPAGGTVTTSGPFCLTAGGSVALPFAGAPVPTSAITVNAATTAHKIAVFEQ